MQFGYFTLSDNRYPGNTRTPEAFIKDIFAEALYAEQIGLNSAWIGEHHFNLLGVNASPLAILAQLAGATTRLRLAPAVTLLPVHHPLHVAEEWATLDLLSGGRVDFAAGRGYDRKEYEPFGAPFEQSAELFAEGLEVVWRAWTEPGKWSHHGKFYQFKDGEVRPRPAQKPWARPRISASVRCSTACSSDDTRASRSSRPPVTCVMAFARNWWCPRCDPFTPSEERRPMIEPTAPPSWPMLECAGPWTRPSPASSSTVSSKARIRCSSPSMPASSCGSAAFQSSAVVVSSTQSTPVCSSRCRGMIPLSVARHRRVAGAWPG